MQYDFYSWQSLPLSFMHWVTQVKPPLGFEPGSPDWEADDLPTELPLPQYAVLIVKVKIICICRFERIWIYELLLTKIEIYSVIVTINKSYNEARGGS